MCRRRSRGQTRQCGDAQSRTPTHFNPGAFALVIFGHHRDCEFPCFPLLRWYGGLAIVGSRLLSILPKCPQASISFVVRTTSSTRPPTVDHLHTPNQSLSPGSFLGPRSAQKANEKIGVSLLPVSVSMHKYVAVLGLSFHRDNALSKQCDP